jgi:hypothetical protein
MKLERSQGMLYLALGSMFLYLDVNLIGMGFLFFSFLRLKKFYGHPFRKTLDHIKRDSIEFGAVIPDSESIQKRLISVYLNFEKVNQNYPLVKNEIREIIESFWRQVSYNVDNNTWDQSLFKLESLRILPSLQNANDLDLSLNKLKNSFKFLEEAQYESRLNSVN